MSFHSVNLFQENDKWVVVVVDDQGETRRAFVVEQHAHSFADGQRIRLGLPPVGPHAWKNGANSGGTLSH